MGYLTWNNGSSSRRRNWDNRDTTPYHDGRGFIMLLELETSDFACQLVWTLEKSANNSVIL